MKTKILSLFLLILLSIIYVYNRYNNYLMIIMSFYIVLFLGYIIKRGKFHFSNKKWIFMSLILSLISTIYIFQNFVISYKYNDISIKNISNDSIIIDAIYIDSEKVKINKKYDIKYDMINDSVIDTEYKVQNKDTSKYKATLAPGESYNFHVAKKKNIEIQIQRTEVAFDISINNKIINVNSFDYKNVPTKATKMGDYNFKYSIDNKYIDDNISILWIILLLNIISFILINLSLENKKLQCLLLSIGIIEFSPLFSINPWIKIFLYGCLLLLLKFTKDSFSENKNNKIKILFLLSSLYISFSILGKYLIDDISIFSVIGYLLLTTLFYKLMPFFMNLIELIYVKMKYKSKPENNNLFLSRLLIFVITISILFIYEFLFSPYIYLADGFMELQSAKGQALSNWHPYLHILLLKLFYCIFNNVTSFIYFRIIIYALLFNKIIFYFQKKGLSLLWVDLITIIFNIMPTTGTIMVTLLKDVDFSIALVALTFFVYLIFYDFEQFNKNKFNYLFLLISLIGVGFFRHNGFYISIGVIILLMTKSFKAHSNWLKITICSFIIVAFFIKVPLIKWLKVEKAPPNFDMATIIHGFGYIMLEDKDELSKETYSYLTKNILSFKAFELYYHKYNIDPLLHYNSSKESHKIRNKKINKSKLISLYLKQVLKSPLYLLKDRLYGTDIIWNVVDNGKIKSLKYQTLYDEFSVNYKAEFIMNGRNSEFVTNVLNFIANNDLLNILFYRVGLYIDILIILINYQFVKKKKYLICLFPLLFNIITLFIAMHYQAFRYGWAIPAIVILFTLITLCDFRKDNKIDIAC